MRQEVASVPPYLLVGPGAALRTLAERTGCCRGHGGVLGQNSSHVEAVVQEGPGPGTPRGCRCRGGGGGVFRPGLGRQRLLQAAAAAAATVRPLGL